MDFSNYIFRSHMVGQLISVPKPLTETQKSTLAAYSDRRDGIGRPLTENQLNDLKELEYKLVQSLRYKLTDGQKTILRDLVRQAEFGYRDYPNADEMEKGLLVEKQSRDLMSEVLKTPLVKDDERRSNEWVTGKRDIKANIIIDIKSAFTNSSFSKMLDEGFKENENYLRQGDCYMELWDVREGIVSHVLVDSPMEIVEKKIRQVLFRSRLFNSLTSELTQEGFEIITGIVHDHIVTEQGMDALCGHGFQIYGDSYLEFRKSDFPKWNEIPKEKRIHMIPYAWNSERIKQRNECLKISRQYMNTVKPINNLIAV